MAIASSDLAVLKSEANHLETVVSKCQENEQKLIDLVNQCYTKLEVSKTIA